MPLYPKKVLNTRHAQMDASGAVVDHTYQVICCTLGSPVVDDVDRIVTSVVMANKTYIIAAQPDVPRNITVTATTDTGADTPGVITVTGTDRADAVITEVIIPAQGSTIAGLRAFKTVISVVGTGWVQAGGVSDTITIGVGSLIGLPDKLSEARVLQGWLNNALEATLPVLTVSATVLSLNTVDFTTAWSGVVADVVYLK